MGKHRRTSPLPDRGCYLQRSAFLTFGSVLLAADPFTVAKLLRLSIPQVADPTPASAVPFWALILGLGGLVTAGRTTEASADAGRLLLGLVAAVDLLALRGSLAILVTTVLFVFAVGYLVEARIGPNASGGSSRDRTRPGLLGGPAIGLRDARVLAIAILPAVIFDLVTGTVVRENPMTLARSIVWDGVFLPVLLLGVALLACLAQIADLRERHARPVARGSRLGDSARNLPVLIGTSIVVLLGVTAIDDRYSLLQLSVAVGAAVAVGGPPCVLFRRWAAVDARAGRPIQVAARAYIDWHRQAFGGPGPLPGCGG